MRVDACVTNRRIYQVSEGPCGGWSTDRPTPHILPASPINDDEEDYNNIHDGDGMCVENNIVE